MSNYNVAPLEVLVEQFERMPGIGHKTAQRLAYYVLNLSKTDAEALAKAVTDAHTKIHYCAECCNLTDKELCPVCANPARDKSVICVVETPRDASAIEKTHEYNGVYHVHLPVTVCLLLQAFCTAQFLRLTESAPITLP